MATPKKTAAKTKTAKLKSPSEKTALKVSGRIIALDVGEIVIGIAVTDEAGILATPLPPIIRDEGSLRLGMFKKLFAEYRPKKVLVGLPMQEDKGLSAPAKKIKAFANKLKRHFPDLNFAFQDERLSTWSAREKYARLGLRKNDRPQNIDSFSAMEILEDFLAAVK